MILGWSDFVEPFKERSLFWNEIWKLAGSPIQGQLPDIRRNTRAKYHWALKFVKKNADGIIKYKTASILEIKSFQYIWSVIHNMKKKCFSPPGMIDGNTSNSEIANHFANIYSDLYNSANDNEVNEIKEKVDQAIATICRRGGCCDSNHVIIPDLAKWVISKLKEGRRTQFIIYHRMILLKHQTALPLPLVKYLSPF